MLCSLRLYSYDRFSLHNVFEGIFEAPFFVIIIFYNILSDYVSLFVVRWWLAAGISGVRNLLVGPLVGIVIVALFVIVRGITWGIYYMMTELDQGERISISFDFSCAFFVQTMDWYNNFGIYCASLVAIACSLHRITKVAQLPSQSSGLDAVVLQRREATPTGCHWLCCCGNRIPWTLTLGFQFSSLNLWARFRFGLLGLRSSGAFHFAGGSSCLTFGKATWGCRGSR